MKGREKERERRERELEKKAREQADQCECFNINCDKWHFSHIFQTYNNFFSSLSFSPSNFIHPFCAYHDWIHLKSC